MSRNENRWDEARLGELLRAADRDAAPTDRAFLDRLREESAGAFASGDPESEALQPPDQRSNNPPPLPRTRMQASGDGRRRTMPWIALRGLLAIAAAGLVAVSAWLATSPSDSNAAVLSAALDKVARADSVHLQLSHGGKNEQIWARNDGRLRWNLVDGTYRIGLRDRMWLVDEHAKRAVSEPPRFFTDSGLDVLSLVNLAGPEIRQAIAQARPVGQLTRDGRPCERYLVEVPMRTPRIRLEAIVDRATGLLRSLEVKQDRNGPMELLATLTVLGTGEPVPDGMFVVANTLVEPEQVGKITDVQGVVSLKPVMHERWTPVDGPVPLKPGDWLRTDRRGANAVAVHLASDARLTLGPGSLVELVKPGQVRLLEGEIKVTAPQAPPGRQPLEVEFDEKTRQQPIRVTGTEILRVRDGNVSQLKELPLWLKGFEGATTQESLGSLVALVDGRNVPLSVGYHKVSVDIRDQIARTVVEESFVNHTLSTLEGVFYFPLPADASISGFGMWIGNELVEADIVEKQRAREIYETILRERRDPGLLEWQGGNLFKARVFPIPPHAEKRIKISYTQVLPLKGRSFQYSYALQSELLRQHPLRELSIDVKIHSVCPLAAVRSATHPVRADKTDHSAHVEFSAQEYTPSRDFEVTVDLAANQEDLVLIPHRRGSDGYFLLELMPPGTSAAWDREILPDGQPIDLVILADTSASMDADARKRQGELVAALLGSLSPKDQINLAVCDVDCRWAFDQRKPADAANIAAARQLLADRVSLGWTDLDRAFASALAKAGPKTQVVYIGDGIATGADSDPIAFANRLRRLYQGKQASLHAVSVTSTYEQAVLKTIASLGGGSVREVNGEHGPQQVAKDLLTAMTQPGLRDLKVEFRGLRTARVYPQELPNLAEGRQQILLGRYLPEGKDQKGEVIVTGTRDGKSVRFHTSVKLEDAENGNSFIPRLWARMHLDALLEQGSSPAIRDEIIALSEEYHILTPYTSLLVLESDEDRQRFAVNRRFQMRDGEKFFAEGRANANYELVQQQMRRAGNWRIGLRRAVLQQLMAMGRDPRALPPYGPVSRSDVSGFAGGGGRYSWHFERIAGPAAQMASSGPMGLAGAYDALDGVYGESYSERAKGAPRRRSIDWDIDAAGREDLAGNGILPETPEVVPELLSADKKEDASRDRSSLMNEDFETADLALDRRISVGEKQLSAKPKPVSQEVALGLSSPSVFFAYFSPAPDYSGWLNTLFPTIPPPPQPPRKQPESTWPEAARAVARSLLRTETLAKLPGGLRIQEHGENFEPRSAELRQLADTLTLVTPQAWLVRSQSSDSPTSIQWCSPKERGILALAFQLGRVRRSTPDDLHQPPMNLEGFVLRPLDEFYAGYDVELRPQGDNRTLLVLTYPHNRQVQTRILIDTARAVVLQIQSSTDGKITGTTRLDDFVQIAGAWFATRIEITDGKERRTRLVTEKFTTSAAEEIQREIDRHLAVRSEVLLLEDPLPTALAAKRAIAGNKATLADHMALLLHDAGRQLWAGAADQLAKAEPLAQQKPGFRWIRLALLQLSRRHDQWKDLAMSEAHRLAKGPAGPEDLFRAEYLRNQASSILQANESLRLLDRLTPVVARQPKWLVRTRMFDQTRASLLDQVGQALQALELRKKLALENPSDYSAQQQYAEALNAAGQSDAAFEWIKRVLAGPIQWQPYEEQSLRSAAVSMFWNQGRYDEAANFLADWVRRNPQDSTPYQQYLSVLIRAGREDEAFGLMQKWLAVSGQNEPISPDAATRLQATVQVALGQGWNLWSNQVDQRWLEPLAAVALDLARRNEQLPIASQILQHGQFRETDTGRRLCKAVVKMLLEKMDHMDAEQLATLVGWNCENGSSADPAAASKLADGLRRRWQTEKDDQKKYLLGQAIEQVLSRQRDPKPLLAFLKERLAQAPQRYRALYARGLFNTLVAQPWSAEHEQELLGLIPRLSDADPPAQRTIAAAGALMQLTDRMVQSRYQFLLDKVPDLQRLSRTDLTRVQAEKLRQARQGWLDQLSRLLETEQGDLHSWINIERLYLLVRLDEKLDLVAGECWEYLGPEPKPIDAQDEPTRRLAEILRGRYLMTLVNLAARRGAKPELTTRLLAWLERSIALEPENPQWKLLEYQLLVALDRPEPLEKTLRTWIDGGDYDSRWQVALGYLLAEQRKIAPAIELFEKIRRTDELAPADYRTLADWYLVVDRRDDRRQAIIAVYQTMEEWRLQNWLYAQLRPWQSGGDHMPRELDPQVPLAIVALLTKSSSPANYVEQVRQFYQATRDFRLLAGLADAVIGQSAEKIYPLLSAMGSALAEIREEATVDTLVEHIAEIRPRAKTPVDQRALDLLLALVERRAAELKNQPGPHADRAIASLRQAFLQDWNQGEPRLMADFLAGMGRISSEKLAQEQLRQLETLHQQATPASIDRLHIAFRRAQALWANDHRPEATDLLETALAEYQGTTDGPMLVEVREPLDTFISYLEATSHYARGEETLKKRLQLSKNRQERVWLTRRLLQLDQNALAGDGTVSLGSGQTLYKALQEQIRREIASGTISGIKTPDADHVYQLVQILTNVYRSARDKRLSGAIEDFRQFAFDELPRLLKPGQGQYESIVQQVAQSLRDVAGPRDGLAFLVGRLEHEPVWMRYQYQDGWGRYGYQVAAWRKEAGILDAALTERLLAVVLRELTTDLETRQPRNRDMYWHDHGYFWQEKEADFAQAAEEVLGRHKDSAATIVAVAGYLYHGLHHYPRAIDILLDAHRRLVLDYGGESTLVEFLQGQARWAESIEILLPLIEKQPDDIRYRTWLMNAYYQTRQHDKLLAARQQAHDYFHQDRRWTENVLSELARACVETELFGQAVEYYGELIPLHQRTAPRRGIGDGQLSTYYTLLARAHAGQKQMLEAIDAAGAAIVSWGRTEQNRYQAIETLKQVVRQAPDLGQFVALLDADAAKTGMHRPVVRKAVGEVFRERGNPREALKQLKLAAELEPNDEEIQRNLVGTCDMLQDQEGAIRQLLEMAGSSRRNLEVYRDLGRRYASLNRSDESERAMTSIVEALPNESESHAMLAEIRQQQNRWADAAAHWKRVAQLRQLEPTGLLRLAAAQIHLKQWNEAKETIRQLQAKTWPPRFGDVQNQADLLIRQVDEKR